MENKINIAEILKDCPKGMELDCLIYENVTLVQVKEGYDYPIVIETPNGQMLLSKYGGFSKNELAKCIIFPKGKTTWEGFHKPFEDGDIVAHDGPHLEISIFKDKKENNTLSNCYLMLDVEDDELYLEDGMYYVTRFATEEEKKKLFDAIKAKGYKWNPETKTLEKLIEPKFKVGDKIRHKINNDIYEISAVYDGFYGLVDYTFMLNIKHQDNYELVQNKFDVTTLKPFDKVLVRDIDTHNWIGAFYSHYNPNGKKFYIMGGSYYFQCIPYEENKHLLDNSNDCDEYFKTW